MRKVLALVLALVLTISFCAAAEEEPAETHEPEKFECGDYTYILLDDGTAKILRYAGNEEVLVVPDALDGIKVTAFENDAFGFCKATSVTVPDSVTNLGNRAFSSCKSLTGITLPDSVASIGENPFYLCEKLTDIHVSPDHPYLAVIDGALFSKPDNRLICYPCGLTAESYDVPDGVQIIEDRAFAGCSSLTRITLPEGVTSVGVFSFGRCSALVAVALPDSVTTIGDAAFLSCESLDGITLPASLTSIGEIAFSFCRSLTGITIPEGVTDIGGQAFASCSSLTEITIPDSVENIGNDVFSNCDLLTVTVSRDSYAAKYCKENDVNYTYPDILDWLNN